MDVIVRTYIGQHRYIEPGTYELRSLIKYIECAALMYLVLCSYVGLCRYILSHPFTDMMGCDGWWPNDMGFYGMWLNVMNFMGRDGMMGFYGMWRNFYGMWRNFMGCDGILWDVTDFMGCDGIFMGCYGMWLIFMGCDYFYGMWRDFMGCDGMWLHAKTILLN